MKNLRDTKLTRKRAKRPTDKRLNNAEMRTKLDQALKRLGVNFSFQPKRLRTKKA